MFCEHEWMNENVRDIEAREYRGARVLGPRGPRAGRLWWACEMRRGAWSFGVFEKLIARFASRSSSPDLRNTSLNVDTALFRTV